MPLLLFTTTYVFQSRGESGTATASKTGGLEFRDELQN